MPTYSPEWDPGDARANNEHRARMGFGGTEFGGQQYSSRARMLGEEAGNRAAFSNDFTQADQSRGYQTNSLDLLKGAAEGTAPSQAAILARQQGNAATAAATSMAGSVKGGPGARVAAMRAAMAGNAAAQQQNAQTAAAARAAEMAQARGQYAGASTAVAGTDLERQKIIAANENAQRERNDRMRSFYENMGFNIQKQDQDNQLQQEGMANGAWAAGRAATQQDEAFGFMKDTTYAKAAAGGAAGAAGGIAAGSGGGTSTSDEAAKDILPAGSLAGMMGSNKLTSPGGGSMTSTGWGGNYSGGAEQIAGGGMDPMGGIKFQNNEIAGMRNMTGGVSQGLMRSDVATKNPRDIMYSPGEIKNPVDFDQAMRDSFEKTDGARYGYFVEPYQRDPEMGVAGARRGYAAERAGQPGGMFGAQQGDAAPKDVGVAPGTDDFAKHGAPVDLAAKDSGVDWNKGGATKAAAGGGGVGGSLLGFLNGIANTTPSDVRGKNVMYSDDKTKLAAAWDQGHAAALADVQKIDPKAGGRFAVEIAARRDHEKEGQRRVDEQLKANAERAKKAGRAAPSAESQAEAARIVRESFDKNNPVDADRHSYLTGPRPSSSYEFNTVSPRRAARPTVVERPDRSVPAPEAAPMPLPDMRATTSDEKAKRVVDLDEGVVDLDKPEFDQRGQSRELWFRRDTPEDQARVKRGVEDSAGREADRTMAGYKASMERGASTKRVGDKDAAKLAKEADDMMAGFGASMAKGASAKKTDGHIPDVAMFAAMKSMKPSLYAYKPEFKPPEQSPGEVQAGPMANNMERDPVAGTAIVKDPHTGLLAIDKDKALKLTMGSLAVLADDVEQLKRKKGARKEVAK